jgi:CHAT domain
MERSDDPNEAAPRAYEAVLNALQSRDRAAVERSLERLFDCTERATTARDRALAGHGLRIVAGLFLSGSTPERALPPLQFAWEIVRQLGAGEAVDSLVVDLASVPYVLVTRGAQGGAQGRTGGGAGIQAVFLGMLTTLMAPVSSNPAQPDSQLSSDEALRRIGGFADATDAVRLMLGCYAFGMGMSATDRHLGGAAMAWYRAAAALLESLRPSAASMRQLVVDVASLLYPSMAFERQIGGDETAMRRVVDRLERCLTRLGVDVGQRNRIVRQTRAGTELNHAIATDNAAACAAHARSLIELMSLEERRQQPEKLQYLVAFVNGQMPPRPHGPRSTLGNPAQHLQLIATRLAKAMQSGDIEDGIAACLEGLARGDRALTWRSAAFLVNLGVSQEAPSDQAALAILFGKIALRELQFLALESIAHGYRNVTPFADGLVDKFVPALIAIMVRQGRLGEALRTQLLMEADRAEIPKPRVSDLEAAVDDRCPLLATERDAARALGAMRDHLDTIRRAGRLRDRVQAIAAMVRPRNEGRRDLDAPPELYPPPPGTAVLSVWNNGVDVIVSLMGPWGEESHRQPIGPARLNERVYDTLRLLHTHDQSSVRAACAGLHDAILRPVTARLAREAPPVLVIQTMGALRHVPFGILFDGEQFLVERHAVVLHPGGIRIHIERGLTRPLRGASLTLERTPGQPDLHDAHADGECLVNAARRYDLGGIVHWRDAQVTAERLAAVAATRPTLWHLSGHFEANPANVADSAFMLGDGSRFSVRQLAALDWTGVELALLMGCATRSVGESHAANVMDALDTALLHAGVGSVVSTGWRVRDKTAHRVMGDFAEALFGQGLDQAAALQRAVLAVGRDRDTGRMGHPGTWGAYMLSGGWRGLRNDGG